MICLDVIFGFDLGNMDEWRGNPRLGSQEDSRWMFLISKLNPGERLGEITEMGKTSISRFSQRLSSDIMKYFESLASGTVCLLIYF